MTGTAKSNGANAEKWVDEGAVLAKVEHNWSTSHVGRSDALAYWQDAVCKNLLELTIKTKQETDFFGHISSVAIGPMKAYFISVSEQRVWRTQQGDRRNTQATFHLIQVRSGIQLTEQRGLRVQLGQGDCVLVNCLASFEFGFPQGVEALVLEIRRDWLKGWLPAPEDAVGRVFGNSTGWGATLSSALRNLTPASIASADSPHHAVAEQIAGLLALAMGPSTGTLTSHKRALLRRINETIRERCHEQDLDPGGVAKTLRLSRRYIHTLFASAGTTFSQELYKCRLQRAERVLKDQKFAGVGIGEIAWNCGFSGPSHFARRFREIHGVTPSIYRSSYVA